MVANTGASAAAAIAAQIQAVKACGSLVHVGPEDFALVLTLQESPFVVHGFGGFLTRKHMYLTSYRGLTFHCRSDEALDLPSETITIQAQRISVPDVGGW